MADFTFTATRGYDADTGTPILAAEGLTVTYETTDNLVDNFDFSNGTTSWTASNATLSVDDGKLKITNSDANAGYGYQALSLTNGAYYVCVVDYTDKDNSAIGVGTTSTNITVANTGTITASGKYVFIFKATASTLYMTLRVNSGATGYYSHFDNVAVYPATLIGDATSTELVTNVGFDASPEDSGWTEGTGWTIGSGVASASAASADLEQTVSITNESIYLLTFTVSNYSAGTLTPKVGGTSGTAVSANGTYYQTIVAGASNSLLEFTGASLTADIDNVSLVPAIDDLSSNNDGFGIYGEITKVPVAVGSNVCAVGGFSATAYIEQPYTSSLDFGTTTDFSFIVWFRSNPISADDYIFYRRDTGMTGAYFYLSLTSTGTLAFQIHDGTSAGGITSTTSGLDDGEWHYVGVSVDISGITKYMYIDGALDKTDTDSPLLTISNSTAVLRVGAAPDGTLPLTSGQVFPPRFYNTILTASQHTGFYEDEKHLFKRYSYFTQVGESYFLSKGLKDCTHTIDDKSTIINALDGVTDEVINHYTNNIYDIRTNFIPAESMQPWRELVHSTKAGETFTFKAGGRFEPNQNTSVRRLSFQTTEQREGLTKQHTITMKLKEV